MEVNIVRYAYFSSIKSSARSVELLVLEEFKSLRFKPLHNIRYNYLSKPFYHNAIKNFLSVDESVLSNLY